MTYLTHPEDTPMFDDDDIIFAYTRAEALEDGVLVDVSQLAHERRTWLNAN